MEFYIPYRHAFSTANTFSRKKKKGNLAKKYIEAQHI
jgi:hypothetical protein